MKITYSVDREYVPKYNYTNFVMNNLEVTDDDNEKLTDDMKREIKIDVSEAINDVIYDEGKKNLTGITNIVIEPSKYKIDEVEYQTLEL